MKDNIKVNPITASVVPPAVQLVVRGTDGYTNTYVHLSIDDANALIAELSQKVVEAQGGPWPTTTVATAETFPPNRELKQGEIPTQ